MSHGTLPVRVLGTAEALSRRIVPTAEVAALCGIPAQEAVNRSGVNTRHWIRHDEDPLDFGVAAAEGAVRDAGLRVDEIDVVLNASGTPMQAIPDGGALIAAELGLRSGYSYSLHGTCISFLFAFQEAAFLIATDRAEKVLVVSTEGGSRGLNFAQPESALLIGDAAAAVVVGRAERPDQGLVASSFHTHTKGIKDAQIRGFGTRVRVDDAPEHLLDFKFDMQGLRLLGDAIRHFPAFLEGLRPGLSTGTPGIDTVIPHQTSKAGMEVMSRFWGWDKLVVTLGEVGNTIAASIPLALHRARPESGQTALLVGTGAGTHYGALIVRW